MIIVIIRISLITVLCLDSVKFLLHLADISNTIRIIVGRNSDSKANILTIVRDVLNKRCEELVIIDRFSNKKITWLTCADVEKFIQVRRLKIE